MFTTYDNDTHLLLEPRLTAQYTLIWLHGLGADGHDFVPVGQELLRTADLPLRFIFPHAPQRPVTINGGAVMPAWYDITGFGLQAREDRSGLTETAATVGAYIAAELARGLSSERIFLGGFSQGAAAALYTALRYSSPLAGVVGYSGYLPFAQALAQEAHPANQTLPIFLGHGKQDAVVLPAWAEHSYQVLRANNYPASLRCYDMEHHVCAEELKDTAQWLLNQMLKHNTLFVGTA